MKVLRTDRLLLRPLEESDWQDVHAYAQDAETTKFMTWGPNTEAQTKEFVRRTIAWQKEDPSLHHEYAVIELQSKKLVGCCGLTLSQSVCNTAPFSEAMVGYCMNKEFWGRGIMTESVATVLDYAFDYLKLHRVSASCDPLNVGSWKIMEKVGMRKEAHFVANAHMKGAWRDTLIYAILDHEWKANTKAKK